MATPPFDPEDFPHALTLSLLGTTLLVRAAHREFLDGVGRHFSSSVVPGPWISPDLIIYCNWTEAAPYFFRSRPRETGDVLPGVFIQECGTELAAWSSLNAPMPPMSAACLQNRFVSLHSAVVSWEAGPCVLLLGNRGSGKSTLSLKLVQEYGGTLLSDENAMIHRRTRLIEPFARALHIWEEKDGVLSKSPVPVTMVEGIRLGGPALATNLVFLEPTTQDGPPTLVPMTATEAFEAVLNHNLDFGCDTDECIVSLLSLVRDIPSARLLYAGFEQVDAAARLVGWLSQQKLNGCFSDPIAA